MRTNLLLLALLGVGCPKSAEESALGDDTAPNVDSETAEPGDSEEDSPDSDESGDTSEPVDTHNETPSNTELPKADCVQYGEGSDGDTWQYTFDSLENSTEDAYHNAEDSAGDYAYRYVWNEGLLQQSAFDDANDGVVDALSVYTYEGQLLATRSDDDTANGDYEEVYRYTYDGDDNLSRIDRDDEDDGTIDAEYVYTRDEQGRVTMLTIDEGPDGLVDTLYYQTITELEDGEVLYHLILDEDADEEADRVTDSYYDNQERLTYQQVDSDGDGVLNWAYTYGYDEVGLLATLEYLAFDARGDEDYNVFTSYTYDRWDRDEQWYEDWSFGDPYIWEWTWSCSG